MALWRGEIGTDILCHLTIELVQLYRFDQLIFCRFYDLRQQKQTRRKYRIPKLIFVGGEIRTIDNWSSISYHYSLTQIVWRYFEMLFNFYFYFTGGICLSFFRIFLPRKYIVTFFLYSYMYICIRRHHYHNLLNFCFAIDTI